ncbi:MAG: hypothetical protein GTN70_08000 [Deltaproteobacteria bacterium]|nr:hypothetical protein [Deltaproteobacteria bacterium]NIS77641.1 hypothetical protein [Deltaproteobacteria bacterium]
MRCSKCNGLMIFDKFQELSEVFGGWRCILCGRIVDSDLLLQEERAKDSAVEREVS